MSFASETKKELTQLEVHIEHAKAELAALIRMNGSLSLFNRQFVLNIQTENAAIARRIFVLLKQHYQIESELLVRRKMKLKKNNVYIVRLKQGTKEILSDLGIMENLELITHIPLEIRDNEEKMRSYLRGAFLAGGSVNNPETSRYHLEIYSKRRNGFITYLKEAEKIADFLALIGAANAMMKFEDIRIVRDMRNSVNRLVNCENANINKVVTAASRQMEDILFIEEKVGLEALPVKLFELAQVRKENPDISLKDLGEIIPSGSISKSGVNHRLRKISEFAENLRKNIS